MSFVVYGLQLINRKLETVNCKQSKNGTYSRS